MKNGDAMFGTKLLPSEAHVKSDHAYWTYFNGTAESPSNIVFYSDYCVGQNKNKCITSLYINAVLTMNIQSIHHKFLIVGHTQNEGDRMNSVIEKKKKSIEKWSILYSCTMGNTYLDSKTTWQSVWHKRTANGRFLWFQKT